MSDKLVQVAEKNIPSTPMISHGSWGHREIGSHESTMTLYNWGDPGYYEIEWDIPDIEQTEHIGIRLKRLPDGKFEVTDYDGIMALPKEAADMMREQGWIVPEDME